VAPVSDDAGIKARVYFLSPGEGGRATPIFSGYRPGFFFGPDSTLGNDGIIDLGGRDQVCPGEECIVRIHFLHPEHVRKRLRPKESFRVQEGRRVIGRGTVLEVT
jgi:elongation factor Tu